MCKHAGKLEPLHSLVKKLAIVYGSKQNGKYCFCRICIKNGTSRIEELAYA